MSLISRLMDLLGIENASENTQRIVAGIAILLAAIVVGGFIYILVTETSLFLSLAFAAFIIILLRGEIQKILSGDFAPAIHSMFGGFLNSPLVRTLSVAITFGFLGLIIEGTDEFLSWGQGVVDRSDSVNFFLPMWNIELWFAEGIASGLSLWKEAGLFLGDQIPQSYNPDLSWLTRHNWVILFALVFGGIGLVWNYSVLWIRRALFPIRIIADTFQRIEKSPEEDGMSNS